MASSKDKESKYLELKRKYDKLRIKYLVQKGIDFGKELIGLPYGWWEGGPLQKKEPMWAENKKTPETKEIKSANCAGLLNLIFRHLKIELPHSKKGGIGGTMAYYDYYKKKGVIEDFDINKEYPTGTLIGRKYKNVKDQGHVALTVNRQNKTYVLQSFDKEGVNMKYTLKESHDGGYYQYAVLPENWVHRKKN